MNISIPVDASTSEVVQAVRQADEGVSLVCQSERQYALVKIALVKLQRSDLSVELQNGHGYLLKQLVARRKSEPVTSSREGLAEPQIKAVRALEAAFRQCYNAKLSIIGFSDGLVAVPVDLGVSLEVLSSTSAMDVDAQEVYRGFEPDYDE